MVIIIFSVQPILSPNQKNSISISWRQSIYRCMELLRSISNSTLSV